MGTDQTWETAPDRQAPTTVTDRPPTRWWWLGGFCIPGLLLIFVAPWLGPDSTNQARDTAYLLLFGLACCAIGAVGLRFSVVADSHAVRVTNLFRRYTITWAELADVEVEEGPGGGARLAFVTTGGRRMAFTGRIGRSERQWRRLVEMQDDLLAMRDRYTPTP